MNPGEFSWKEDQQVTVTNPTATDYHFKVHNKEYVLGAGKSAKMPGYIAWVYVYGLSTQLVQADGKFNRWNEEEFRKEYYEKLVVGVDEIMQPVQEAPTPAVHTFDEEESSKPAISDPAPKAETTDDEEGEEPEPNKTVKPMSAKAKDAKATAV